MVRALIPLAVLLAGCTFNTSPYVGKWEAILDPRETVPLMMRPMVGGNLPIVRLNLNLKADHTFSLDLPVVGSVSGNWLESEGKIELKVSSGQGSDQLKTSLEGLKLVPDQDKKRLTLSTPGNNMFGSMLVFTRADGK